jgi:hypothetical protein
MKMSQIKIAVKVVGVSQARKTVEKLRNDIERFYALGKKHKIPRSTLTRLLTVQVNNQDVENPQRRFLFEGKEVKPVKRG